MYSACSFFDNLDKDLCSKVVVLPAMQNSNIRISSSQMWFCSIEDVEDGLWPVNGGKYCRKYSIKPTKHFILFRHCLSLSAKKRHVFRVTLIRAEDLEDGDCRRIAS